MAVVPMLWRDVPGGVRVVLSSGRVVRVLDRVPGLPGMAMLRSATGHTRAAHVDPGAVVPMLFDEEEAAVAALKTAFTKVEFIREVSS